MYATRIGVGTTNCRGTIEERSSEEEESVVEDDSSESYRNALYIEALRVGDCVFRSRSTSGMPASAVETGCSLGYLCISMERP